MLDLPCCMQIDCTVGTLIVPSLTCFRHASRRRNVRKSTKLALAHLGVKHVREYKVYKWFLKKLAKLGIKFDEHFFYDCQATAGGADSATSANTGGREGCADGSGAESDDAES